jgi:hypothetical protein
MPARDRWRHFAVRHRGRSKRNPFPSPAVNGDYTIPEHFQVKWTRLTIGNVSKTQTRAGGKRL